MENIITGTIVLQHQQITPSVFVNLAEQARREHNQTLAIVLLEQAYAAFDRAGVYDDSMSEDFPDGWNHERDSGAGRRSDS